MQAATALVPVLLLTLVAAGCEQGKLAASTADEVRRGAPRAVPVVVAQVVQVPFLDTLHAVGTTRANESIELSPNAAERIHRIAFREGELAVAGELLVALDSAEEAAELSEAQAILADARRRLERLESLVATHSAAQAQSDEQRARVEAAAARVEVIRARMADRELRAPFAGLLGLRRVSPGAFVGPGDVITTLDDISTIKLDFSVPENFLPVLRVDALVHAQSLAYPDEIFTGRVAHVDSRVDPVTRAVAIRAEIPNPDLRLRPGMLLTVALLKDRRQGLMVPEAALIPQGERQFLFRVKAGRAERVEVRIGARRPGIVEVLEGLAPGQRVVVEGGLRLQPDTPVQVARELDALGLVPEAVRADRPEGEAAEVPLTRLPAPGSDA